MKCAIKKGIHVSKKRIKRIYNDYLECGRRITKSSWEY
jgi:hypothetical protein